MVVAIPAIVDKSLLFTFFLMSFALLIISAPMPISAALRKTLLTHFEGFSGSVTRAAMTSIFFEVLQLPRVLQHSSKSFGKLSDWTNTFLVPEGSIVIIDFGFIGFKVKGGKKPVSELRSTSWLSESSSKKPFATSFIMPSPPIGIMFLKPLFRWYLANAVPSPSFFVK